MISTHLMTLTMMEISNLYLTLMFGGLSTATQLYLLNNQTEVTDGTAVQDEQRDSYGTG